MTSTTSRSPSALRTIKALFKFLEDKGLQPNAVTVGPDGTLSFTAVPVFPAVGTPAAGIPAPAATPDSFDDIEPAAGSWFDPNTFQDAKAREAEEKRAWAQVTGAAIPTSEAA